MSEQCLQMLQAAPCCHAPSPAHPNDVAAALPLPTRTPPSSRRTAPPLPPLALMRAPRSLTGDRAQHRGEAGAETGALLRGRRDGCVRHLNPRKPFPRASSRPLCPDSLSALARVQTLATSCATLGSSSRASSRRSRAPAWPRSRRSRASRTRTTTSASGTCGPARTTRSAASSRSSTSHTCAAAPPLPPPHTPRTPLPPRSAPA